MKRYVQTRAHARSRDYGWLGERPGEQWLEKYRPYTFFEHRTFILEVDGEAWRLYASAIPSARRDAVGTEIWNTVMLEGSVSEVSEESDTEEAHNVLGAALLDLNELGVVLDQHLEEDF